MGECGRPRHPCQRSGIRIDRDPKMRKTIAVLIAALGAAQAPIQATAADEPPAEAASLLDAITEGKPLLYLRPRYEYVDQENKPDDANAYTMRTLFGWRTKPWH